MALLGETLNVVSEGLDLLMPAAPEDQGVVKAHIGALEVTGKDLPWVIPTAYDIS
jgi:hypothetical protein